MSSQINGHFTDNLASFAKENSNTNGPGVVSFVFRSCDECEAFTFNYAAAIIHSEEREAFALNYAVAITDGHQMKNTSQSISYEILSPRLNENEMNQLRRNTRSDRFVLSIAILATNDGSLENLKQTVTMSDRNPGSEGLKNKNSLLSVSRAAEDFIARLQKDEDFEDCRTIMKRFRRGPGSLLLRNIFDRDKIGYKEKEIKRITPNLLFRELNQSLQDVDERNATIFYYHLQGNSLRHCGEDVFPQLTLSTNEKAGMNNPNILCCRFFTHINKSHAMINYC